MENKEETKMAYIAGLLDGDGSFSILLEKRSYGHSYVPCIQISNVFEDMINFFHDTFGGSKKIKSRQGHAKKTQYVWNVRGAKSCAFVLKNILPFIVLKKKQACLLYETTSNPNINNVNEFRVKIQALNNECLVADGKVVKQAKKNTQDVNFWAYFAGVLDTDGSFSIRKNKPSWGCVNYKYNPIIQLSMSTFETMNYIRKNVCMGKICFPKASCTQRGYTYKLAFGKISECVEVIKNILPFLRFKKAVAEELLRFCENYKPVSHKQAGVTIQELEFRENCHQKIKQLNKNEIYKPSLIDSEVRQGNEAQG